MPAINNTDDILDVLDIIDAVEEHEEREPNDEQYARLSRLLGELRGEGGDHQWRGGWYPGTLIRDSYFIEYAKDLAEDIGGTDVGSDWPYYCIDWKLAARELQVDYSSVEFGGITYWYR